MLVAISLKTGEDQRGRACDILEHNYIRYFERLGATLLMIPNPTNRITTYLDRLPIEGIIISGGGDINRGSYPRRGKSVSFCSQREALEEEMIKIATERRIPLLGICRGVQLINVHFGGNIVPSPHPIGDHQVLFLEKEEELGKRATVNSFHHWSIRKETQSIELKAFAVAEDGTIEGLYHPSFPIAGVQWHPEREAPERGYNRTLMKAFFNQELFWKSHDKQ